MNHSSIILSQNNLSDTKVTVNMVCNLFGDDLIDEEYYKFSDKIKN